MSRDPFRTLNPAVGEAAKALYDDAVKDCEEIVRDCVEEINARRREEGREEVKPFKPTEE